MKIDKIVLVLHLILLTTCDNSIDETWLVPTDTPQATTSEQLLENGYKMVKGVDVLLYEKVIGDTLYGYQLNTGESSIEENGVGFQYWRVLKSLNSPKEVNDFLAINNLYVVNEDDESGRFVVVNGNSNAIFICDLIDKNYFNIVYYHLSID